MKKQVIVMRTTDIQMQKGKMISQGAHASMGALLQLMNKTSKGLSLEYDDSTQDIKEWLENSFTKVTLRVDSLEELMKIHDKAKAANLNVCLITDNGLTQFKGVPTVTCLAIGPHEAGKIDVITGELKLL